MGDIDLLDEKEALQVFKSAQEEAAFWKAKYLQKKADFLELDQSFEEYRTESAELEEHLESELERAESNISQLSTKLLAVQEKANETAISFREKMRESSLEVDKFQQELIKNETLLDETRKRNRKLEQENDDLERHKREAEAVVDCLRYEKDQVSEEKICLEVEYEDYVQKSEETIQRLRQEILELTSELQVKNIRLKEVSQSPAPSSFPPPSSPSSPSSPSLSTPSREGFSKKKFVFLLEEISELVDELETRMDVSV